MILDTRNLLTTAELCERLQVSHVTLLNWRRYGINGRKLPICRVGHRVYYDHAEVIAFLGWEDRDNANSSTQRAGS